MKITASEARNLAIHFRSAAVALGDRRLREWEALSEKERSEMDDREWSLLMAASDVTTMAVGLIIDEVKASADQLAAQAARAEAAIRTVKNVKAAVEIAGALLILAASIVAQNPPAIAAATGGLADALSSLAPDSTE